MRSAEQRAVGSGNLTVMNSLRAGSAAPVSAGSAKDMFAFEKWSEIHCVATDQPPQKPEV